MANVSCKRLTDVISVPTLLCAFGIHAPMTTTTTMHVVNGSRYLTSRRRQNDRVQLMHVHHRPEREQNYSTKKRNRNTSAAQHRLQSAERRPFAYHKIVVINISDTRAVAVLAPVTREKITYPVHDGELVNCLTTTHPTTWARI